MCRKMAVLSMEYFSVFINENIKISGFIILVKYETKLYIQYDCCCLRAAEKDDVIYIKVLSGIIDMS